jgi:hypothetical protein
MYDAGSSSQPRSPNIATASSTSRSICRNASAVGGLRKSLNAARNISSVST